MINQKDYENRSLKIIMSWWLSEGPWAGFIIGPGTFIRQRFIELFAEVELFLTFQCFKQPRYSFQKASPKPACIIGATCMFHVKTYKNEGCIYALSALLIRNKKIFCFFSFVSDCDCFQSVFYFNLDKVALFRYNYINILLYGRVVRKYFLKSSIFPPRTAGSFQEGHTYKSSRK